jgi:hypothetical protein
MADKILVVDDSFMNLSEKKSSSHNNKTKYVSPTELANLGNSGYTYTEVDITPTTTTYSDGRTSVASGISAMGSTPIELLAAPGADNYYEVDKVRLEYTHVTTGYTYTDEIVLQINSNAKFIKQILGTTNRWLVISDLNGTEGVVSAPVGADIIPSYGEQLNKGLYLNTYNGTNPTLGDGTLRAIITYRVRTFGS